MAESQQTNILIIGGGIVGASTAYYLSRHPAFSPETHKVTIVEAVSVAACASGKAGGFLASDWHPPATTPLSALSFSLHSQLSEEHGGATRWGYRRVPACSLQADLDAPSLANGRSRRGEKEDLEKELGGWLGEEVIKVMKTSGLGTEKTCAQVHPELLTKALVELSGATVVVGEVVSLARSLPTSPTRSSSSGRITGAHVLLGSPPSSSRERITLPCDTLVLAAGPWLGQLATTLLGEEVGSKLAVTGSRAHSIVLRPQPSVVVSSRSVFTDLTLKGGPFANPEFYPRPDGTIYCCGATDPCPLPAHPADVAPSRELISELKAQAYALSPEALLNADVLVGQACFLPVCDEEKGRDRPLVGKVKGVEGVWVGGGLSCWGITQGPGTGKCLAQGIMEGKIDIANVSKLAPP